MIKLGEMVCKGVIWVQNIKNQVIWSWKESIGYTMIKLDQNVLKGVNWINNDEIRSNGLERSQLGTQYKKSIDFITLNLLKIHKFFT